MSNSSDRFSGNYRYEPTGLDSMGQDPGVAMLKMLQEIKEANNARRQAVLIRLLGTYCELNGISEGELEEFVGSVRPRLKQFMFPDSIGASVIDTRKSTQLIGGDARAQGEEEDPWDWGVGDPDVPEAYEMSDDEGSEPF